MPPPGWIAKADSVLLHGGLGGALVEGLAALSIVVLALLVWLRERRRRTEE